MAENPDMSLPGLESLTLVERSARPDGIPIYGEDGHVAYQDLIQDVEDALPSLSTEERAHLAGHLWRLGYRI